MNSVRIFLKARLRFDRNELSGAFGDIGTVFPLIIGILIVTGMDGAGVFMAFGIMQIMTALVYGIPMPVQPLKAAALLVITQKLSGGVLGRVFSAPSTEKFLSHYKNANNDRNFFTIGLQGAIDCIPIKMNLSHT